MKYKAGKLIALEHSGTGKFRHSAVQAPTHETFVLQSRPRMPFKRETTGNNLISNYLAASPHFY
ncbi:hypothetical protein J2X76_003014 [Neorhizobium sp. 2083]|nr:hypothetical protein [Neorhizobium sp. 2083]